jgi:hypothetical protein
MGFCIHFGRKASVSIRILLEAISSTILHLKRKPRNQFTLPGQASTERERMKLSVESRLFVPLLMKVESYPGEAWGIRRLALPLYFSAVFNYKVLIM